MEKICCAAIALIGIFSGLTCLSENVADVANLTSEEVLAIYHVFQIRNAQTDYHANSNLNTYAESLSDLHKVKEAKGIPLIDEELASGRKGDYLFTLQPDDSAQLQGKTRYRGWTLKVKPADLSRKTRYSFYCDQRGLIKMSDLKGDWGHSDMPVIPEDQVTALIKKAMSLLEE